MMHAFQRIPPELFYQIALHLPRTKDVLAFRLTNTLIRDALSTPVLFKARLALRGWDVSAWNDEDDAAQSPGDLGRWTRIDHSFCRTAQLFDEAAAEGYFPMISFSDSPVHEGVIVSGSAHPDPGSGQDDRSLDPGQVPDEKKPVTWLRKLSGVLPLFVTHHRGGNISRITEAKYLDALRAYATVVDYFCTGVVSALRPDGTPESVPKLMSSQRSWFERICFSLIALLLQCDATTTVSIFTENLEDTIFFQESDTDPFEATGTEQPSTVLDTPTPERISERYSAVFFFQTILLARLHLDAEREWPEPLLPAPSLPHFDPRSSSFYYSHPYHGNGAPVEPEATTTTLSAPLRPWLYDGLAGTPFAALSSTTSRAWAGYYTCRRIGARDPPMYIELRSTPAPHAGTDTESAHDRVHFRGEGYDRVGTFVIIGTCDTRTSVISAIKTYEMMHQWEWRGMLTPFGIAGMWGAGWGGWGGWWWIWPREWSPATTGHHD